MAAASSLARQQISIFSKMSNHCFKVTYMQNNIITATTTTEQAG